MCEFDCLWRVGHAVLLVVQCALACSLCLDVGYSWVGVVVTVCAGAPGGVLDALAGVVMATMVGWWCVGCVGGVGWWVGGRVGCLCLWLVWRWPRHGEVLARWLGLCDIVLRLVYVQDPNMVCQLVWTGWGLVPSFATLLLVVLVEMNLCVP